MVVGLLPFQQGKEFHDPVGRFDPPLQKPANFFVIWLIWYTVGWLVGGCGARAASRKTSITFILYKNIIFSPFRIFFRKSLSDFLLRGWGVLPLSAKGIFKGKGKVRVPP